MISSAGSKAAARASRTLLGSIKPASLVIAARNFASTPFVDFVPESVREEVKSTVLTEATKPGSNFWGDAHASPSPSHAANGSGGDVASNLSRGGGGANGAAPALRMDAQQQPESSAVGAGKLKGRGGGYHANGARVDTFDMNDPISEDRIHMLNDPLDEWYLDRKPSRSLHWLPDGVRPKEHGADPFVLAKADMQTLSESIRRDLIGSDHPVLARAASYFFEKGQEGGKKIRPMMVVLLSRAMALSGRSAADGAAGLGANGTAGTVIPPQPWQRLDLPEAQRRLAEISEMIHTASLFHDDVIDGADTRRGSPSVHRVFGNKMAILAGDYLLARACIYLARLRDVEVVETMSTIIEQLVRGEVMQMKGSGDEYDERLAYYLRKNFYKTGSLMANSCKSAAILGGYSDRIVSAAYRYGKHVGMAFQLVDDVLDFDGSASTMGKPALSDLNAGLATAPVLFAAEDFPGEMDQMIARKFGEEGDVELAVELVRRSDGIERTKDLAHLYAELAIDALMELEGNPYRDSLVHLAYTVVDRVR